MKATSAGYAAIFICCFFVGPPAYSQGVQSIEALDEAAVFRWAMISDMMAKFDEPVVYRSLEWIKDAEFIFAGGDEIKSRSAMGAFDAYFEENPDIRDKFFPCIGGGENRALGGSDVNWGTGAEFFNIFPGFWDRRGVEKAAYEPHDRWGNTPSYYAALEVGDYTVHLLQIHSPDDIHPPIAESSLKWLDEKLIELEALKRDEPGRHIVYLHGHRGAIFKNLGESYKLLGLNQADNQALRRAVLVPDIVTDADQHSARRFWHDDIFFRDALAWYPAVGEAFEDPNACLWYNTGIVSGDGYLAFHVLENPTRVVVQYINAQRETRSLVTESTWGTSRDRKPVIKEIGGPVTYVDDWSKLDLSPPVPPGPPVILEVTSSPRAIADDGSTTTVTATVKDGLGRTTTQGNGPITFSATSGGTLVGPSTVTPVEGRASTQVARNAGQAVRVTAVMGALSGSTTVYGLTNLLENPSFEAPGPVGEQDAAAWIEGDGHRRSDDQSHGGSWSIKSVSSGTHTSIVLPVEAGETYTVSGFIINGSEGMAYIDMNDAPGELSLESSKGVSGWQEVKGSWKNSAGMDYVTLRLVTDGGNTQAWFDDITFLGAATAVCNDAVANGQETDVDCGGPTCPSCPAGSSCQNPRDCDSQVCSEETCVEASCFDATLNGDEEEIDCGGACPPCTNTDADGGTHQTDVTNTDADDGTTHHVDGMATGTESHLGPTRLWVLGKTEPPRPRVALGRVSWLGVEA